MPKLITLSKMPSRRVRPPESELPPWQPATSGRRILEYLLRYRYLTSDLVGLLHEEERGRGRYQVRQQLTKLWRYGLVERFFRPADWGSNQYVYTVSVEGARLVVEPKHWPDERRKIYNLAAVKADYEHALAVSLLQVLWDLGSNSQAELFTTVSSWQDKEGTKSGTTNEFIAKVDGKALRILPDLTVLIAHQRRDYYRPYFFEIERTHKNYDRLRRRFLAYQYLLSPAGDRPVAEVFQREVGIVPARGMVVFVGADRAHADRLRRLARTVVPLSLEFWFTSVDQLLEEKDRRRADGSIYLNRHGNPQRHEVPITPNAFFDGDLLVSLNGKAGRLVI
jgi:hypothetical protein